MGIYTVFFSLFRCSTSQFPLLSSTALSGLFFLIELDLIFIRRSCKTLYFPDGVNCCTSRIKGTRHAYLRKRFSISSRGIIIWFLVNQYSPFLKNHRPYLRLDQSVHDVSTQVTPVAKNIVGVTLTRH